MARQIALIAATVTLIAGCNSPQARLNAPPHGAPPDTAETQGTFVYMADNALLSDMSVSDMHFMPHRAMLTSVGEERVARLVSLMDAYGGDVRLSTDLEDQQLVNARRRVLTEFLTECGVENAASRVVLDMPGARDMWAAEAIEIRVHEGTYSPEKKSTAGNSSSGRSSSMN